jgi:DNA-binding beta-propeller fold protein YncE
MRDLRSLAVIAGVVLGSLVPAVPVHAKDLRLETVADVPLPGDTSRFDYESLDAGRHLLFIAHLGASEVLAVDVDARRVVARNPGLRQVHGVLAIPELGLVYATATGTDEVVAMSEDGLAIVARIPGGKYPDGLAYDPRTRKLYVSDETGETETVIDVRGQRRIATIALGGEVGNTQFDPASGHFFVNVQSRGQLVEIDPETDRIVDRIDLPQARGNHGLAIDPDRRIAFVACEDNDKLLIVDLRARRVRATFDVGQGPDVLAYDAARARLFVATESGAVSVVDVLSQDGAVSTSMFAPNAHVIAVDPVSQLLYLPLRSVDGRPVLRIARVQESYR